MEPTPAPVNRCGHCRATSYLRLPERQADGVIRFSDRYRCTGCPATFTDLAAWRRGDTTLGNTVAAEPNEPATA